MSSSFAPGFGDHADDYDRYRPDYPAALWDTLLHGEFSSVVDVGCGTGRATRELQRRGLSVIGVEPDAGMRREAAAAAHRDGVSLELRAGSAEETGLPAASADLVTCAQAFHWFDAPRALREIRRILRPGGTLAVWWNDRRVVGVPYMEEYEALVERMNPAYRRGYRRRDWSGVIANGGFFGAVDEVSFPHARRQDARHFIGLCLTSSYVRGTLSESEQRSFARALAEILRRHHGEQPFEVVYDTTLYRAGGI